MSLAKYITLAKLFGTGDSGGGTGGSSEIEEQWIRLIEGDGDKPVTKLPDGLTKIREYAFRDEAMIALTSLPDGLVQIDNSAFVGCYNLALTSLPDSLTVIGEEAFSRCENLAITSIPGGVSSIGTYAFYNCLSLTEITFRGKPKKLGTNAFYGCDNLLIINVPWAEGEVAGAPWGADYATINYNYTGG